MKMLLEVKEIDREFYRERLQDFLPDKIIDIHTHVWLAEFQAPAHAGPVRTVTWPRRVAVDNSIEDLMETYRLLFPDQQVTPMIFPGMRVGSNFEAANAYVEQCTRKHTLPGLTLAAPGWTASELEDKILSQKSQGVKVYLTYANADIPVSDITIFDFLPSHQLEILNKHGWIVMLHIPRDLRLKDPVNLAQMLEIERTYPNVKLIIAHVGRAYCIEDVGNAFEVLTETQKMMFDFSANTNQEVFEQLIKAVGPRRIMFGSDMPITQMRMKRICENRTYINLVPQGLYGDVTGDKNMREAPPEEAEKLTFFIYEQIEAFRQAAEACGLIDGDIEDIFHHNAYRIIYDED